MQNTIQRNITQNPQIIKDLGLFLYEKIAKIDTEISQENCINYLQEVFKGNVYIRKKSVIYDGLAKIFPDLHFEESPPELDHGLDVDYLGHVGEKAFGIQIKPITAKSNFGNYSISERMKASFQLFTEDFGGKVFIVFSNDGEIGNTEIIEEITKEIDRLSTINLS
jgi:MjaI restriction endonuclease